MKVGKDTIFHFPELSNIGDCVIGSNCKIHSHVWIGDLVRIGDRVKIQAFVFIPNGVTIHDDVFIGPRVTFTNDRYPPSNDWQDKYQTIVESGVSLGAGAVILPGIKIRKNAKIGAGAVVTHDVPEGETWVGNPARPL